MQTKLITLLGHPIAHSKSSVMHNAAFQVLQLPYIYTAVDVLPGQLTDTIAFLKGQGFHGANVTIPYKVEIMNLLDDMTPLAKKIGAVNTVYVDHGRLIGDNTDGQGYIASLVAQFPQLQLRNTKVGIIGSGGAARAIAFTLAQYGVNKLYVTNRNLDHAEQLVQSLMGNIDAKAIQFDQFQQITAELQLLIHTTPIGMSPKTDASIVPLEWLRDGLIVSDIIYNPIETKLLSDAHSKGALIHNGVGMLLYQGALSFERWTGTKAPIEVMREQLLESLK